VRRVDNLFTWHIHNSVGHSGRSVLQRRRQNIFCVSLCFLRTLVRMYLDMPCLVESLFNETPCLYSSMIWCTVAKGRVSAWLGGYTRWRGGCN